MITPASQHRPKVCAIATSRESGTLAEDGEEALGPEGIYE